jgi:hypothetical protein
VADFFAHESKPVPRFSCTATRRAATKKGKNLQCQHEAALLGCDFFVGLNPNRPTHFSSRSLCGGLESDFVAPQPANRTAFLVLVRVDDTQPRAGLPPNPSVQPTNRFRREISPHNLVQKWLHDQDQRQKFEFKLWHSDFCGGNFKDTYLLIPTCNSCCCSLVWLSRVDGLQKPRRSLNPRNSYDDPKSGFANSGSTLQNHSLTFTAIFGRDAIETLTIALMVDGNNIFIDESMPLQTWTNHLIVSYR